MPGADWPHNPRGFERPNRLFVVPKMDAIMMRRMHRLDGQHLIDQRIDRFDGCGSEFASGPRSSNRRRSRFAARERPWLRCREDCRGRWLPDRERIAGGARCCRGWRNRRRAIRSRLVRGGWRCALAFDGFGDDRLWRVWRLLILAMRHAPIGHSASRVDGRDLPERSFGLEIPKAVQLADALIEKRLRFARFRGDREIDFRACPASDRLFAAALRRTLRHAASGRDRDWRLRLARPGGLTRFCGGIDRGACGGPSDGNPRTSHEDSENQASLHSAHGISWGKFSVSAWAGSRLGLFAAPRESETNFNAGPEGSLDSNRAGFDSNQTEVRQFRFPIFPCLLFAPPLPCRGSKWEIAKIPLSYILLARSWRQLESEWRRNWRRLRSWSAAGSSSYPRPKRRSKGPRRSPMPGLPTSALLDNAEKAHRLARSRAGAVVVPARVCAGTSAGDSGRRRASGVCRDCGPFPAGARRGADRRQPAGRGESAGSVGRRCRRPSRRDRRRRRTRSVRIRRSMPAFMSVPAARSAAGVTIYPNAVLYENTVVGDRIGDSCRRRARGVWLRLQNGRRASISFRRSWATSRSAATSRSEPARPSIAAPIRPRSSATARKSTIR